MSSEQMLSVADIALFAHLGRSLTAVEMAILKGALQKQTYEQIATDSGYSAKYLTTDVGPKLWRHLSQALGESISKTTCQAVLERLWREQARESNSKYSAIRANPYKIQTPTPHTPHPI